MIKSPIVFPVILILSSTVLASPERYAEMRKEMVEKQLKGRDITNEHVLRVMGEVPRHEFVPAPITSAAYDDRPLPIGKGQTISQPYIVALMTQVLDPRPTDRLLEIGTGSGYQAAVLSRLAKEIYTIEIVESLAVEAGKRLARLGYDNVRVRYGDGFDGWPRHAPFDGIMITAAVGKVPPPLLEQLADGGRLVLPMGEPGGHQILTLITKRGNKVEAQYITGVRFVPMTGKALGAWHLKKS